MSTVYLHVGPHKTGSTYLQEEFSQQEANLNRQGVLYPSEGREYSSGHHNLAWYFHERPLINASRAEIERKVSRLLQNSPTSILLSSEEFSRLAEPHLTALKNAFADRSFQVLYFTRKGAALVFSLWQELIKNGMTMPFSGFTASLMSGHLQYDPFAHEQNIAKYEQTLNAKVHVFDYNYLMRTHTDLMQPVTETLQVALKATGKRVNPSQPAEFIELIRAANLYNSQLGRSMWGFPRIACHRVSRLPFFNWQLARYLKNKFKALCSSLTIEELKGQGFQSSAFLPEDEGRQFAYIPGSELLHELNKDNILPWRIIKMMIQQR